MDLAKTYSSQDKYRKNTLKYLGKAMKVTNGWIISSSTFLLSTILLSRLHKPNRIIYRNIYIVTTSLHMYTIG